MNYKNKYLKYKTKYFNLSQKGGNNIPNKHENNSWFYMPIILYPFEDIIVNFPVSINKNINEINEETKICGTLDENIKKLKKYYSENNIELFDRRNLLKLKDIKFIDIPKYKYLDNFSQLKILEDCGIKNNIDNIIKILIEKNIGEKYIFDIKDYKEIEISNFFKENEKKIIKIQNINKKLYEASNIKDQDEKDKTYKIYNDVEVIMREATDNNDVVLIYFGFRDDIDFNLFFNLNRNHSGMILYFIDKDSRWYDDKLGYYINIINELAKSHNKYAFYGMSMGGYASIIASLYFPGKSCIVISSTPQTINFKNMQNLIVDCPRTSVANNIVHKLDLISINIPKLLEEKVGYTTKIYTLVGKSECNDNKRFLDLFHIGIIMNFPNVSSIVYDIPTHKLGNYLNIATIISTISLEKNFDLLFNDQNKGNTLLFNSIKFRPKPIL